MTDTSNATDTATRWAIAVEKGAEFNPSLRRADDRLGELAASLFNPSRNPEGSPAANRIFFLEEQLRFAKRIAGNSQDPERVSPVNYDTHDEFRVAHDEVDVAKVQAALAAARKSDDLPADYKEYFFVRYVLEDNPNATMMDAFTGENLEIAEEKFGYTISPSVMVKLESLIAQDACDMDQLGKMQPPAGVPGGCIQKINR